MRTPATINTASGASLDLSAPDPHLICLEDVAAALSKLCRFAAQTSVFYSVAQHAVLVRDLVVADAGRPDLALPALHHDSHEAFAGDIPTPLKRLLGDPYRDICFRLDSAIGVALEISWPEPNSEEEAAIKAADAQALEIEGCALLRGWSKSASVPPRRLDAPLSPSEAEQLFLVVHAAAAGST